MSEIRIARNHQLGLAKARRLARRWAAELETRFGSACTVVEGKAGDTVDFARSGISGRLLVTADRFEVEAQLGFLFSAFSNRIEAEITQHLDALLATEAAQGGRATRKPAAAAPPARNPAVRKAVAKKPKP